MLFQHLLFPPELRLQPIDVRFLLRLLLEVDDLHLFGPLGLALLRQLLSILHGHVAKGGAGTEEVCGRAPIVLYCLIWNW